jgi:hypothetical protein
MLEAAAIVLTASTPFIHYPPVRTAPPRVEVVTDRGPILEIVVRCPVGTAIITYSKIERVFCGPKGGCSADRHNVIGKVCR